MNDDVQPLSTRVEVCEGVDQDDAVAVAQAVADIVPDPAAVTIIISQNLDADARRLLGDAAGERDVERAWSQTSGITIGSNIVIAAQVFEQAHHHVYVASHEAFHVALSQREESTHTLRTRGVRSGDLSGHLVAIAGVGAEEYRVDVALALRFSVEDDSREEFGNLVLDFARRTVEASAEYQQTLDVGAIAHTMIGLFQELTRYATSQAAVLTQEQLFNVAPSVPAEIADVVLGKGFLNAMEVLRETPSANVETPRAQLDALALRYAAALDEWFAQIGFRVSDEPSGVMHFAVLEAEYWDALEPA